MNQRVDVVVSVEGSGRPRERSQSDAELWALRERVSYLEQLLGALTVDFDRLVERGDVVWASMRAAHLLPAGRSAAKAPRRGARKRPAPHVPTVIDSPAMAQGS